jgi:hypothetical protein
MVVSLNGPMSQNSLVIDLQGGPNTVQFDNLQKVIRELFEKVKELAIENQSQHRALVGASNELVSFLLSSLIPKIVLELTVLSPFFFW